ncbi:MAG: hypothetical protein M3P51_11190 [Chloroflexota bacterium]|nr:hypothetical protein [Chloroflexota bacterium]
MEPLGWRERAERRKGGRLALDDRPWVSASELGRWAYCEQAFFLARSGVPGSSASVERMRKGARTHRELGRRADTARHAGTIERALLVGAAVCALLLVILLVLGR